MTVHVMRDYYGEEIAQTIADDVWIPDATEQGWVIFSKDYRMRSDHLPAINEARAKVFLLPDAQMRSVAQCERYVENRYRIALKCRRNGPMLYRVGTRDLTKLPLRRG